MALQSEEFKLISCCGDIVQSFPVFMEELTLIALVSKAVSWKVTQY